MEFDQSETYEDRVCLGNELSKGLYLSVYSVRFCPLSIDADGNI